MSQKTTDTSDYVGHMCSVCGKLIKLSESNGYYRRDPSGKILEAAHIKCRFPIRKNP